MALNSKQLRAIPILIASDTVEEAAQQIGIARTTLYSWLEKEEFDKALKTARQKLFEKAMNKIISISIKAVLTLEQLLSADSEAVRRASANDILSHALKHQELSELEERLEAIEKIIGEGKNKK